MRAFDHELGQRKGGRMDVGVGETKPMAKVMRSKEARWRMHQTKPGNQKTMKGKIFGVAINKCGFAKGLNEFKYIFSELSRILPIGEGSFLTRSYQTSVCQCFTVHQVQKSSRETKNRSGA